MTRWSRNPTKWRCGAVYLSKMSKEVTCQRSRLVFIHIWWTSELDLKRKCTVHFRDMLLANFVCDTNTAQCLYKKAVEEAVNYSWLRITRWSVAPLVSISTAPQPHYVDILYVWVLATLSCRLLRLFQYFDNFWFSAALAHVQLRVVRELTRKQQGARRSLTYCQVPMVLV